MTTVLTRWPVAIDLGKGALQQDLREQRLGVDVGAVSEQDEAGEREDERE